MLRTNVCVMFWNVTTSEKANGGRSFILFFLATSSALSPTGNALSVTDLSPLTNGIWEIHAEYPCLLRLQFLAKSAGSYNSKRQMQISLDLARM